MRGMVTSHGRHIISREKSCPFKPPFPKQKKKNQPLFSGAFLGDSKFDQAHNAMFALAHEAFPAGFQAAKPPIFAIKAGRHNPTASRPGYRSAGRAAPPRPRPLAPERNAQTRFVRAGRTVPPAAAIQNRRGCCGCFGSARVGFGISSHSLPR